MVHLRIEKCCAKIYQNFKYIYTSKEITSDSRRFRIQMYKRIIDSFAETRNRELARVLRLSSIDWASERNERRSDGKQVNGCQKITRIWNDWQMIDRDRERRKRRKKGNKINKFSIWWYCVTVGEARSRMREYNACDRKLIYNLEIVTNLEPISRKQREISRNLLERSKKIL